MLHPHNRANNLLYTKKLWNRYWDLNTFLWRSIREKMPHNIAPPPLCCNRIASPDLPIKIYHPHSYFKHLFAYYLLYSYDMPVFLQVISIANVSIERAFLPNKRKRTVAKSQTLLTATFPSQITVTLETQWKLLYGYCDGFMIIAALRSEVRA